MLKQLKELNLKTASGPDAEKFGCSAAFNLLTFHRQMEVIIQPNKEAAAALVARVIAHDLRANPTSSSVSYRQDHGARLSKPVRMHKEAALDFSLCSTFNLDEYVGLFPSDPNSTALHESSSVPARERDPRNTHLPNGMAVIWTRSAANMRR